MHSKNDKATVYLTSPVFFEIANHPKVSPPFKTKIMALKEELARDCNLIVSSKRFPEEAEIIRMVSSRGVDYIGCHISHPITNQILEIPSVKAVCTSTVGYDHVFIHPNLLISHTPSILHKSVADFTIALILVNLRNLIPMHNFVWSGKWGKENKWDLDENLTNILDNLSLGIIGLGEIGKELVKRIAPWGIKILYYDLIRNYDLEDKYNKLQYRENIDEVLKESHVVSLHVPLNDATRGLMSEQKLRLLQSNALLVNTARGAVIDFPALIRLLKSQEITIHLAFDVYPEEPLSKEILREFQEIQEMRADLRITFIPHNASSDADTRAQMSIMMLEDLLKLSKSKNIDDIKDVHLIPEQHSLKILELSSEMEETLNNYRIWNWWQNKD